MGILVAVLGCFCFMCLGILGRTYVVISRLCVFVWLLLFFCGKHISVELFNEKKQRRKKRHVQKLNQLKNVVTMIFLYSPHFQSFNFHPGHQWSHY